MAGFTTLVANEIAPYACATLRYNKQLCSTREESIDSFIDVVIAQRCYRLMSSEDRTRLVERLHQHNREPCLQSAEILEGDLRTIPSIRFIESSKLGSKENLFCIAGGPPCQPFSRAGNRRAVDDAKNGDLFYEFVRVVSDLKPRWFLFENVKGLLLTKTDVLRSHCSACDESALVPFLLRMAWGRGEEVSLSCPKCGSVNTRVESSFKSGGSLEIILAEFEKLGYRCHHKTLNAADFGAPQLRERLFIVGSRDGAI
jgi:DNA (cytosine-5)-methyltransferase 1